MSRTFDKSSSVKSETCNYTQNSIKTEETTYELKKNMNAREDTKKYFTHIENKNAQKCVHKFKQNKQLMYRRSYIILAKTFQILSLSLSLSQISSYSFFTFYANLFLKKSILTHDFKFKRSSTLFHDIFNRPKYFINDIIFCFIIKEIMRNTK